MFESTQSRTRFFENPIVTSRQSALVGKLNGFARLSNDEMTALDRLLHLNVRNVKARTTFLEFGSSPTEISVMLSGWACRIKPLADGGRQIVAFHLPGDVCDFNALLTEDADTATQALVDVRVAGISREAMSDFTARFPRVSQALWRESLVSAATQREWFVNVCRRTAQQRLAHLYCELTHRLTSVQMGEGQNFEVPVSQADLGNACGLTAEHTSRTIRQLRIASMASFERGNLTILDAKGMERLAQFDPSYLTASRQKIRLEDAPVATFP